MKARLLSWIAQATSGRLVGEDRLVDAIATDTRALPQGRDALFVALKGGNFDGHDHVATAASGGCVAALVVNAMRTGLGSFVPVAVVASLVGFVSTSAVARYVEGRSAEPLEPGDLPHEGAR